MTESDTRGPQSDGSAVGTSALRIVKAAPASTTSRALSLVGARLRWALLAVVHPELRARFVRIDRSVLFTFGRDSNVRIGQRVHFRGAGQVHSQGMLTIGDDVFFGLGVVISNFSTMKIGSHVRVGERVSIHDENHVYGSNRVKIDDWSTYTVSDVVIEDGVWIGANSVVLPGASVGSRSVVAAGSVVRGVIPSDCLAAGNPAVVVRRFSSDR